jgi:hypothetical protein
VTRALRILAITDLLLIGVTVVFIVLQSVVSAHIAPLPVPGESLVLLFTLVLQTGFFLAFAAGIVATVASVQQQRTGWTVVFIILLVAIVFGPESMNYLLSFLRIEFLLGLFGGAAEIIAVRIILPALLAALVLIFAFTRRREIAVS